MSHTLRRADIRCCSGLRDRKQSQFYVSTNRPMYHIDPEPYFICAFCVLYGVSLIVVAVQLNSIQRVLKLTSSSAIAERPRCKVS